MAWFGSIGNILFKLPKKYWHGNLEQYKSLSNYDFDTLYQIENFKNARNSSYVNNTNAIYIGTEKVFPPNKDGYDFYFENLLFPDTNYTGADNIDYEIGTDILLGKAENINKNWQLEFKATLTTTGSISGDQTIIGAGNNSSGGIMSIYLNPSGHLCLYGAGISDAKYMDNANGHDIKIIRNGSNIELYKDNVLDSTITTYNISSEDINGMYYLGISRYSNSYRFHGTINYIGFKWLS